MSGDPSFYRRITSLYLRLFSFAVRRIVAPLFVLGGGIMAIGNLHVLFPGGTIMVDGAPSDDFVLRAASVFLPLLMAALGVAMYRAPPVRLPGVRND